MRRTGRPAPAKTEQILLSLIAILLLAACGLLLYLARQIRNLPQAAPPTSAAAPGATLAATDTLPPPTLIPPTPTLLPSATPRPAVGDVESLLAQMSLEQMAGQMVMGVIPEKSAGGEGEMLIRDHFLGGFILFSANVTDAPQTARLTRDLQAFAAENNLAIPLFVAMDSEGGRGTPFQSGATDLPYQMALGAADSPELAFQAAALSARELLSMGINLTFRPVVDVNVEPGNPVINLRSFGSSTARVSDLSAAYIAGLQESGLIAVAKHFPGHGDTTIDSHGAIPVIDQSLEALQARDLAPFTRAMRQQAGGIMAGHIANPRIDPEGLPASLSAPLIDGLLREELGFDGVVFSDALMMGAIINNYPLEFAVLRAVEAGCDVVMLTNPHEAANAHEWIVRAASRGRIPPERIMESARRILTLKAQYGLLSFPLPEAPAIAESGDSALVAEISRRAIYAQNFAAYPLLPPGDVLLIGPDRLDKGDTTGNDLSLLGELLSARGLTVHEWFYPVADPAQVDRVRAEALAALDGIETILVVTYNAHLRLVHDMDGSQDRLIQSAIQTGLPVVVVAVESPYDLRFVPPGQPALATFGSRAPQLEALVEALLAAGAPPGILPVDLGE
jgi:beta-N-acetylhexosaminidase